MNQTQQNRGGAPVGVLSDLDHVEAASVLYLRLWSNGPDDQARVWNDMAAHLGPGPARKAMTAFENLCQLCAQYGRRPLMRHAVTCSCLGADEACFANFIATAASADREDAMLIATLLVRADVAPLMVSLATDFGLALTRMNLAVPPDMPRHAPPRSKLH